MLAEATLGSATVIAWMAEAGAAVRQQRDHLTQLGDGDHGTNMVRGFDAVETALAGGRDDLPPGRILILCGKTLVATVGGASGPLWGSALRGAGRALGEATETDGAQLAAAVDAALASIQDLGAAVTGDKTIVDALAPAAGALRDAVATAQPLFLAVEAAAAAAEAGARATVPLQARKGRASYLGARSIGHQDPGATSAALIMLAGALTWPSSYWTGCPPPPAWRPEAPSYWISPPPPRRTSRSRTAPPRRGSPPVRCGRPPRSSTRSPAPWRPTASAPTPRSWRPGR